MNKKYNFKQASQQELLLYCIIGESVCFIQHVEDALSHSIVLKKTKPKTKDEADKLLVKQRKFTLGEAIKIAKKEYLYPDSIMQVLNEFLKVRNWLIHKSVAQSRDDLDLNISRDKLISRIKAITTQAQELIQLIEEDLIVFAENNGKDISRVKAAINKHYFEE